MKSLPIRRNRFDTQGFLAFLSAQGCEIGKPSNPYEVVRYRAYWQGSKKPLTHIVYAKENGLLTWMQGAQGHYLTFLQGGSITGNKPPFVSQFEQRGVEGEVATQGHFKVSVPDALIPKSAKTRAKLRKRDGDDCWFCGEAMGDDCTLEHLVPKSKGGGNTLANYALAHSQCNGAAGDLPLVEKIAMRDRLRAKSSPIPVGEGT